MSEYPRAALLGGRDDRRIDAALDRLGGALADAVTRHDEPPSREREVSSWEE